METSDRQPNEFTPSDLERVTQSTFIHSCDYHDTLASTNDRALSLLNTPHKRTPTLVLASQQTAGRGRGANRWWSTTGSLTFSLILSRNELGMNFQWPQLSLTAGLAVCDALHDLRPGLEIGLKWPNDVLARNRKICGILVEAQSSPEAFAVVGIGVNVNNSLPSKQLPLSNQATSLQDVSGYAYDLTSVLIRILMRLQKGLYELTSDVESLRRRWQSFCVLTGNDVQIQIGSQQRTGRCLGIDTDGALLVDSHGETVRCVSGIVANWH